eukprot:scaffold70517_cov66-Phaeocystis_antarctica.AAC.2
MFNVPWAAGCARFLVLPSSGIEPARAEPNVPAPIDLTTRPRACEWRWLQFGITPKGPSSPHPGVNTGAYATPLVACTGRGERVTRTGVTVVDTCRAPELFSCDS